MCNLLDGEKFKSGIKVLKYNLVVRIRFLDYMGVRGSVCVCGRIFIYVYLICFRKRIKFINF